MEQILKLMNQYRELFKCCKHFRLKLKTGQLEMFAKFWIRLWKRPDRSSYYRTRGLCTTLMATKHTKTLTAITNPLEPNDTNTCICHSKRAFREMMTIACYILRNLDEILKYFSAPQCPRC